MSDYLELVFLISILIISYLISKKSIKNWDGLSDVSKSLIIKALFGVSAIILILIYKIIKG
jgi:hypothetical protein